MHKMRKKNTLITNIKLKLKLEKVHRIGCQVGEVVFHYK